LHSWPVFLLAPLEVGILTAVIGGLVALLWNCGLPRLHHPMFDIAVFERASQDRFFLLAAAPDADHGTLRQALERTGALSVSEMWST
jgi:small basic protein